jgi:hypothetical protein
MDVFIISVAMQLPCAGCNSFPRLQKQQLHHYTGARGRSTRRSLLLRVCVHLQLQYQQLLQYTALLRRPERIETRGNTQRSRQLIKPTMRQNGCRSLWVPPLFLCEQNVWFDRKFFLSFWRSEREQLWQGVLFGPFAMVGSRIRKGNLTSSLSEFTSQWSHRSCWGQSCCSLLVAILPWSRVWQKFLFRS